VVASAVAALAARESIFRNDISIVLPRCPKSFSQNSFDRALRAASNLSSPRLRSSLSTRVFRTPKIPQGVTVTIYEEFACLVSQLLQLSITRCVGNSESTEIIEATGNEDRYIEGLSVLHTIFSRY